VLQYIGFSNTMIGILTPVLLVTSPLNVGQMIQDVRNWESERNRTPVEEMLNNSLQELEWEEDGSNDTPKSEELLQLPSNGDSEGSGRGHDRCSDRSWIRFIQERTGKDCGVGDADVSLNEQMITEGYAWAYDGGTKQKNFEELREIRRSLGSLVE
jgi:hypothetical protein